MPKRLTDRESLLLLQECLEMGRGLSFFTGRRLIREGIQPTTGLDRVRICRFAGLDPEEYTAGIEYQRRLDKAVELALASRA